MSRCPPLPLLCLFALAAMPAAPALAEDGAPTLAERGIRPRLVWANDYAHNVSGGLSRGGRNAGGVVAGADFDLDRLLGIRGATLRVTGAWYYGDSVSRHEIGNRVKVQGYWYPDQQAQLAQLSWEQDFADGRWQLVAGRINTTWQFARSRFGCRFVGASDCPFQLPQADGGFVCFPFVNWGAKLRYKPGAAYLAAGAFELKPQRRLDHGFDWRLGGNAGVLGTLEAGYESAASDGPPRRALAGLWYNPADYADLRYNRAGAPRALAGGAPHMHTQARWGGYAMGERMLYRDPAGGKRNLTLAGAVAAPFDRRQVYDLQANLAVLLAAPFASRPGDSLAASVNYYRFGARQQGYMNDLLAAAGSGDRIARDQFMAEVNYAFRIGHTPLTLVPNLQFIANPDILGRPDAGRAPADAWVAGLRVMFNAGGPGTPK